MCNTAPYDDPEGTTDSEDEHDDADSASNDGAENVERKYNSHTDTTCVNGLSTCFKCSFTAVTGCLENIKT